jgi:hypothetical protein
VSLADALERAAGELPAEADSIRPANGDPLRLLEALAAPAAARVLDWLLRHEAADSEDLLETWSESEEGRAALFAIEEAALPKSGRKLLRRTLHRLRSRGVETPEPAPEQRVATLPSVDDTISEALVTPLDPSGARLVYLVERDPSGGARVFEIALDDRRGILDASVYSAGRSKVRSFLREISERPRLAAQPAPPESVRALLARAAARQPAERRLPGSFAEWKAHLTGGADEAATPGARVAEALGATADGGRIREAAERVTAGEAGPWPEPSELLGPVAERIRERASSESLVSAAQRREQAEQALTDALDELYGDVGGTVCAERLRETAYVCWKRGEEEAARVWLAAAAAFAELPPRENPVARALLEATLAPLLESLGEEGEEAETAPLESPILIK